MSLVALTRSPSPPRTPARARLVDAATELRRAIGDLEREDRERAAQRARANEETDRKVKARIAKAKARAATREYRIEVPAKFFWDFSATALDAMHELAKEARNQGQIGIANSWANRADEIATALEKLQQREATP
jgi:hypothetical protein